VALLLIGTAFVTLWQLGYLPLTDVDEPVYGQVGKEMAHAGWRGWLTPHNGGLPWFDKPPLFYWLTALSMRGLGVSEMSARLPSALLGIALVGVTYALARRAFPETPRTALWAGFALATCVQFFLLARAAVTDMTLTAALTLALYGLYVWTTTNQGRWIALAGLMTGLAALTKGPVALVLIGLQTIAYLCLTRQARRLLSPALWAGFGLCLVVALPWYLAMIHLHGQAFISYFLEANNVTRYLQAEHQTTSPFWFFVPVLFAGLFPWSLGLPGALIFAWQIGRTAWAERQIDNPMLFFGLWVALVFVFFSASQSKLITYIFPLYPAAAVLLGYWLARRETFAISKLLVVYAILNMMMGIALWMAGRKFGVTPLTLGLWLTVLIFAAVSVISLRRQRGVWLLPGIATTLVLLLTWCSPTWKVQEVSISERKLAADASAATPPGGIIHALGLKHPSLRFYATRPVAYTDDRDAAARDLRTHPGVVYAMRPKDMDDLRLKYHVTNFRVIRRGPAMLIQATTPSEKN